MTTLIAVYNSDGCVGRCDARCYEAKSAKCHCICGGRNHSAGKLRAMENVAEGVGMSNDELVAFLTKREDTGEPGTYVAIDRTKETDAKRAREKAYMAINQMDMFAENRVSA
jgi:hypothetical protein